MAPYLHFGVAAGVVLVLGFVAYLLTGRRSLSNCLLVAAVSGACGAFLPIRVFGLAQLSDWNWLVWSSLAAIIGLFAFFLFRSKR